MADLDAALMEQFLHVTVTERETVVEPNSVLDDHHRKAVAVGFGVAHGRSAYSELGRVLMAAEGMSRVG